MTPQNALPVGSGPEPVDIRDGAYAWFVASVMAISYMVSIMDRSILPLLITPIQHSMAMSDTTISLLQGATFAIFFALFGIPLARLADRGNRRNLIIPAVCFWCLATIGCGLARSGEQLFLARICVAIGEAVLAPSALSILSDYFTPKARVRAMSLWSMGSFFGGGLALAGGGALYASLGSAPVATVFGPLESWRIVFMVLGALGFLLVPLLLSVREPRRVTDQGRPASGSLPLAEALQGLRAIGWPLVACIIGFSVASMGLVTMQAWLPTLFVRAHHWQLGAIGKQLGLFSILLGPLGAFSGAVIAERLERQGIRNAKFRVGIGATLACCASAVITTLGSASVAMGGALCVIYFVAFNFGLTHRSQADPVDQGDLGVCHTVKAAQDEDVSKEGRHGLKDLLELKAIYGVRRRGLHGKRSASRCAIPHRQSSLLVANEVECHA